MSHRKTSRRWIDPQDFIDLRKQSGLTRLEAAKHLDVTKRTIQNWETGGARIPWMAYRMLRILRGYALPGVHWEGWKVYSHNLISPSGRIFDAASLDYLELVFSQARLWRQMYSRSGVQKTVSTVIPFPDRHQVPAETKKPPQAHFNHFGGKA
jgi:DNA-binding XRE family transcriptional regulator